MRISSRKNATAVLRCFLELKTPGFAQICGLSLSALEKIEAGRLKLSDEAAFKISLATGVEKQWLLEGDPGAPIRPQIKARVRNGRVTMLPKEYTKETFEEWQARKSHTPFWKPEEEAARLAGIIAAAYQQSKVQVALAKYKTDEALDNLEKMCGMNTKRRNQYQRLLDGGLRLEQAVFGSDEEISAALRRILKDADRDEPISRKDIKKIIPLLEIIAKHHAASL